MKPLWRGARRVLQSDVVRPMILILAVLVLWQVAVTVFRIPKYLIPAPGAVAATIQRLPSRVRTSDLL